MSAPKTFLNSILTANGYAIAILALLYFPYLIYGERSFIGLPFDYLNSNAVWLKIISENQNASLPNCATIFPNIMSQPRVVYGSEINFIFILYKLFPVFWALVINNFIISIIGFISFQKLLEYFLKNLNKYFKVVISLLFALLPFWQFGGVSIAGFPFIFVILHKIFKKSKLTTMEILFFLVYPFYSYFIVFNIFLYFFAGVYFLAATFRQKSFSVLVFTAILIGMGMISEYRFLQFALDPCFPSNRENLYLSTSFTLESFLHRLTFSNQHAPPLHFRFIVGFVLLSFVLFFNKLIRDKKFFIILGTIVLADFLSTNIVAMLINNILKIDLLRGFSFHRFKMINQIAWTFLFAYVISEYYTLKNKKLLFIPILFISLQAGKVLWRNTAFQNCLSKLQVLDKNRANINFDDYYMLAEYSSIEKILPPNKNEYKVIHFGIDPAASSYHGYSTIDGFLQIHDKNFGERFNEMTQPHLDQNPSIYERKPFHNYVVTENCRAGENYLQNYSKEMRRLNLDHELLTTLGGSYMISTVPLLDHEFEKISIVA